MDPITTATAMVVAYLMKSGMSDSPMRRLMFPFDSSDRNQSTDKKEKKPARPSGGAKIQTVPSSGSCTFNTTPKINRESVQAKENEKTKKSNTATITQKKEEVLNEKLITAVVERVKTELPSLIEKFNSSPSQTIVSETFDAVYKSQLIKAQEFLNENRHADLSRIKCLLHKLLSKEYFDQIEQLREHQDPQNVFNIHGGQNIIAPNAEQTKQNIKKK